MKGLVFSEPMVKAWLAGRKDVTRRLMNPQPEWEEDPGECQDGIWRGRYRQLCHDGSDYSVEVWEAKPRYLPGETVYIKETWMGTRDCLSYKASDPRQVIEFNYDRWCSPMMMPEWAARSHARIVSVRPERVQEITEEDAMNEGITGPFHVGYDAYLIPGDSKPRYSCATAAFEYLWESLHPGSWERNDWVWRIELRKEANHA